MLSNKVPDSKDGSIAALGRSNNKMAAIRDDYSVVQASRDWPLVGGIDTAAATIRQSSSSLSELTMPISSYCIKYKTRICCLTDS